MDNLFSKKSPVPASSAIRPPMLPFAASLVLIVSLLTGCSKNPAELQKKYMASGLDYLAKGKNNESIIEFQNLLKINPKSAAGHFYLGEGYKAKGWITDALLQFRQASELDPTYLPPHLEIARYEVNSAQWPAVLPEVQTILKLSPSDPEGWTFKGQRNLALGDTTKAQAALTHALEIKPDFTPAVVAMGDLELALNQPDKAKEFYQKALSKTPDNSRGWIGLGKVAERQGQKDEALANYKKAVSVSPTNIRSSIILANYLAKEGHLNQAIAQLQLLSKGHTDIRIPLKIAEYDTLLNKNDEAIALLRPYGQQKVPIVELYFVLAKAYEQSGNKQKALENVDKLMALKFDNQSILMAASNIELREGNPTEALKILSTLKDSEKNLPGYWLSRSTAELELGHRGKALSELEDATSKYPENIPLKLALANAYSANQKPSRAMSVLNDILSKNPDNTQAIVRKAGLLAQAKGLPAAISFLKASTISYPNNQTLEVSYIQALSGNKEINKAIQSARDYLQAHPSDQTMELLIAGLHLQEGKTQKGQSELKAIISSNPKALTAITTLANLDLGQKHFPEAESLFRQAIAIAPDNSALYTSLGETLRAENQQQAAEAAYQKALEINPNQPLALLELSQSEISAGETPRAIIHLTPLLKLNFPPPQQADVQWLWGIASMQEGEYPRAERALVKATELAPGNFTYHESLGDLWAAEGDFSKADKELSKAYSLDPQNTLIRIKRDWIALNLQKGKVDPKKIQTVVNEASQFRKDNPKDQTAAMIEARGDAMLGKSDEAMKVFDSVLSINPDNSQAILGKSGILVSQKHVNQARTLVGHLLTDHPNNVQANLMLAGIDLQTNNIQDEASRLETVNHQRPNWVQPALALSLADLSLGRFSQAKAILTQLTQNNPKFLLAQFYLARADMGLADYQGAIDTLKPLLSSSKDPSTIYSLMGDASLRMGEKEQAISYWKKALKTAPKNPLILNNLAFLLSSNKKDLPQAVTYAQKALSITKQPFIEDTLGYLLYLSGHYHQAQVQFDAASKAGFKNTEFQYHMGLNEWRLGNTQIASDTLKKAILDGTLTDDEKKKAHEALDQMASK